MTMVNLLTMILLMKIPAMTVNMVMIMRKIWKNSFPQG